MSLSHNQTFNYKKCFSTGSKKGLNVAQRKPIQEGFQAFLTHPQRFGVWNLVVWFLFSKISTSTCKICDVVKKQPYWIGVALNLFSFIFFFSLWLFSFNINHTNGLFQFWHFALNNSFAQRSWNSVVINVLLISQCHRIML